MQGGSQGRGSVYGGGSPIYSKQNIEKQREYDLIRERLEKEFSEVDINNDGSVSRQELNDFLMRKSKGKFD